MQDVLIKQDSSGLYDLQISNSDFESAYGFETAIPISYFTDARASAVQVQEAKNRRGWVGNIRSVDVGRELGGLLWILDQARIIQDTLNFAKQYAQDSLQWMLDDIVARAVLIEVIEIDSRQIRIGTTITTVDNTVLRYVSLWRDTKFNRILQ